MTSKIFKVCIIGFGNIGKKRYQALSKIKNKNIKIKYIVDKYKPKKIAKNIRYYNNWKKILNKEIDLVIICTPSKISKLIVNRICDKFNIIVEKPLSENLNEIKKFIKKSNKNRKMLKVGYNLRYDDGLIKAKNLLTKELIGKIYYIKISYANGAAKTNSNKVGSLLDMGTHSINLLIWLTENTNFKVVKSIAQKNEFLNKSKDDNGFILLKSKNIHSFIHHGFCTWKNQFYLEIVGSKGLIQVNSLSKWKNQKVILGLRKYPDGIPKIKEWQFRKDNSWKNELFYVLNELSVQKKNFQHVNKESFDTIKIIRKIYL